MALNVQCEINQEDENNIKIALKEVTAVQVAQTPTQENLDSQCSSPVPLILHDSSSNPEIEPFNLKSICDKNIQNCTSVKVTNTDSENDVSLKEDSSLPFQSPKRKFPNTKRRSGTIYRQLKGSKTVKVSSKYFNQAHNTQKQWIPPRSPYSLIQEDLFDKPWQLLIATIFLTKTAAKRALPQLHKFLARYPRPEDILQARYEDIDEYFKPLGLTTTRSHIVMRFTVEYLEKDWTYPRELFGIGKYGDDSYRMFCINEWQQVSPDDIPLTMYRNWLQDNADHLGIN